jgi:hypothetical protein
MKFKGTAVNPEGQTFAFSFDRMTADSGYANKEAIDALNKVVSSDPSLVRNGPWNVGWINEAP